MDASFQRSGSRLRVTVQLLATSDGRPLWGGKITTSLDDPFGMQDEVSRQICRYLERAFQSAFDLSNDVRTRVPSLWAFYQTALAEIQLGRLHDAERTADTAARQFPGDVLLHPVRASIAALRGDTGAALEYVELTRRNRRSFGHYHHAQYDVACTFAVLGRPDEALEWLTDAARNGHPCHAFFERDPLLASLHNDLRFTSLMRDLRAECDGYRPRYHALAIMPGERGCQKQ